MRYHKKEVQIMTLNTRGFRIGSAIAVAVLVVFSGIAFGSSQSSANYTIERDVLSGGGEDMGSTGYDLLSTFGQPAGIGASSSAGYRNYGGFWHPAEIVVRTRAMPWLLLLLFDNSTSP